MKIRLLCIGSAHNRLINELIDDYTRRISRQWPFEISCIPDVKMPRSATPDRQKELEGEKILAQVSPGDFLVLLDERGKQMTSRCFADFLARKSVELPRNLIFAVGGPYGFSRAVYSRADSLLGLSEMTFPHELVRLFFVEQIYRAGTILRGEPYHHD